MAELQAMQALTLDPVQAALITAMNTAIADKNTAIAEKQAAIAEKQAAVDQAKAKKKAAKEKAKAAKAEVDQAIADKNAAIADKQAEVDQAKADKNAAIAEKKVAVDQAGGWHLPPNSYFVTALLLAAAANVASPPSSVSIGTDPARRSAIGSLIMVQVKSSDSHHHEACLQLASYLLYYRLQFNDTQIPASVQSWPACLYGMAWLGCNVYVVRVDLKLDGKLIQPAITFCHTEPASPPGRTATHPADRPHPAMMQPHNTTLEPAMVPPPMEGLQARPTPLFSIWQLDRNLCSMFHRSFMLTAKLRLNSSEELTNVVVKAAAASDTALTEQLAREGMALARLNRDRMAASAHRIPELLAFCTADFDGEPGLALVTGLISGTSIDWKQHQPHAASIALQVCDTLRWIHAQGVVHGDIHRGNLLVTETKLPPTPPASPPKSALEPPSKGAVELPPHSIALVDFGLSCFLPDVTREHVQAALLAAPVTAAAAQELQPWLDRVEHNAWEMWPNHFYDIASFEEVATPQADFLGLGLLAVSLEVGGTKVLQQHLHLDDSAALSYSARTLKRHLLRDQDGLLSQLLAQSPTTLLEVQKIVELADQPQPLL
ncbi:hypothetical protein CAOG_03922 [Capsaspora owczarzaki ATCC 30864]|uniref:Protein kinase domain-containing protein n=1 Tax=Capsaspora owczarzaki (strain ATCC 30864) TaxID=595528 RepID=A0A0D2X2S7_CAPO3|nr:hypothetical protein CAOG_03922 [Capsaspora owczarzaki ATCC 30864]KJE93079.1 hypothetical protein CAOG_003922 [Capsaspora owczarzaki ATCC 30864]|eukprot:XP_004363650.2 hypothetical protein CAOG_03922 [Capsaspora owczarzaki ATCC 30864]